MFRRGQSKEEAVKRLHRKVGRRTRSRRRLALIGVGVLVAGALALPTQALADPPPFKQQKPFAAVSAGPGLFDGDGNPYPCTVGFQYFAQNWSQASAGEVFLFFNGTQIDHQARVGQSFDYFVADEIAPNGNGV